MNAPQTATSLAQLQQQNQLAVRAEHAPVRAGFFDAQGFELMQRVSKAFASSTLVPAAYQGNISNCMIALNLARRLGADELMVMQNLYIVHGNPGWSSKFLIACVNTCGRFSALRYEWKGEPGKDDYGCRAWAIEKETNERLYGTWITWSMVKAEKWNSKNGSKWLTMAEQMFVYRAAAFWQRAYAPEISMGLNTAEELRDVIDVHEDGSFTVTSEELRTMPSQQAEVVSQPVNATQSTDATQSTEAAPLPYDVLFGRINAAKDLDILELVCDEIRYVGDEAQEKKLYALADERRKELEG